MKNICTFRKLKSLIFLQNLKIMKQFNDDFKTKLYQAISDIENNSLVEIVTVIRQQSAKYSDIGLLTAAIASFILFSVMMFIPVDIPAYWIYTSTVLFFLLVHFSVMSISGILLKLIPKKRLEKNVEILARAVFQKGGMRFTKEHIGVLFFISYFEKKAIIIADRGVEMAIPQEEWKDIQQQFSTIFDNDNVAENILKFLSTTKSTFNKYIPPIENDINELPDNLEVDL